MTEEPLDPFHFRKLAWDELPLFWAEVEAIEDEHERRAARAWLGRNCLVYLGVRICGRRDLLHPWLVERMREVEANPNGFIDLWARDHYKSTIITFLKTIQDIVTNPESTIAIFSHTQDIATAFLRQIKQELEINTDLKYLYDDVLWADPANQAPKWSEKDGLVVKRKSNPKEASLEAWGLVTGQPTSRHFSHRIYDDVVVPESVTTPDQIKRTSDAFRMSDNLGTEGGIVRVVGTRYHMFDTYHDMIKTGTLKPRVYPATSDGSDDVRKAVFMSPDRLAKKRKDQGSYIFACQMLQNPRGDSAVGFIETNLQYWDAIQYRNLNICIIVDPASGKRRDKNKGDYTCMWVLGRGGDDNWYVITVVRDRLRLSERARMLISLHRQYMPEHGRVFYEETGMNADIEAIEYIQKQENYRFPIVPLTPTVNKSQRIERLIPVTEAKRLYLPPSVIRVDWEKKAVNLIEIFKEEEYLAYPVLAHDDMLDCLSNIEDEEVLKRVPRPKPSEAGSYALRQMQMAMRKQKIRTVV